jgi:hypothetical protein
MRTVFSHSDNRFILANLGHFLASRFRATFLLFSVAARCLIDLPNRFLFLCQRLEPRFPASLPQFATKRIGADVIRVLHRRSGTGTRFFGRYHTNCRALDRPGVSPRGRRHKHNLEAPTAQVAQPNARTREPIPRCASRISLTAAESALAAN